MSGVLTHSEILDQLPCTDKLIMLDRVRIENEKKIVGLKSVSLGEWYFMGHFPNHPIMPGVLQVEAMGQLAELAVWKKLDPKREGDIYIKELSKVKFRRPNNPGDRIFFDVEIVGETSDSFTFQATATNNSGVTCQAQLVLSVRPKAVPEMPSGFNEFDKGESSVMDVVKIASFIPHRYPFLLVDYISKTNGAQVIGVKNSTTEEPFIRRYRDGYMVMTGAVQPEIVAQAGCINMLSKTQNQGKIAYFMAIDKSEFFRPVLPGDQLICDVEIPDTKSRFGKGEGQMLVNGEVVSRTSMMFAIVDA